MNWSWSCILQLTWFVKWEQCHLVLTILGCSQETELRAQINHKETKVEVFIANWYTLNSFCMYVDSYTMNRGQLSIQVHSLCESQGSNSQLFWQKPLYVNVQTCTSFRVPHLSRLTFVSLFGSSYAPMNVFSLTVYLFVFSFLTGHGVLKAQGPRPSFVKTYYCAVTD